MSEEKKSLAETINTDLTDTYDKMIEEMVDANKEETDDAVREGKEEEVEGKEEEVIEEKASDESEEKEPQEDEKDSEEKEEEDESEKVHLEPGTLEPNSGWDKDVQDGFKQLPENMQEFMLKRHHEMQADYTRKTKDVAEIKRALEPARETIDKLGVSDGEAIKNLVGAHMLLQTKPHLGIQYLINAYGMTLESVQENWQENDSFNQNVKESSRISDLESKLSVQESDQQKANYETAVAEINEFKKDHPHYDKVEDDMAKLARAAFFAKEPKPSLESLYDQAVWLNPEVRSLLVDENKPSSGKEVKKAKKASTRLKAAPKKPEKKSTEPTTLHDELSQGWDKGASA